MRASKRSGFLKSASRAGGLRRLRCSQMNQQKTLHNAGSWCLGLQKDRCSQNPFCFRWKIPRNNFYLRHRRLCQKVPLRLRMFSRWTMNRRRLGLNCRASKIKNRCLKFQFIFCSFGFFIFRISLPILKRISLQRCLKLGKRNEHILWLS